MIRRLNKEEIAAGFEVIDASRRKMIVEGISQWNEKYPNLETIANDVAKREIYGFITNEKVAGIIVLNQYQDEQYLEIEWKYNEGKIGVVHRLAVHPNFQNQGIAGKLMHFAEEYFASNQFASIRLDAFSENPIALSFYEKRGYERRGMVYFPFRDKPFWCYEKQI